MYITKKTNERADRKRGEEEKNERQDCALASDERTNVSCTFRIQQQVIMMILKDNDDITVSSSLSTSK